MAPKTAIAVDSDPFASLFWTALPDTQQEMLSGGSPRVRTSATTLTTTTLTTTTTTSTTAGSGGTATTGARLEA